MLNTQHLSLIRYLFVLDVTASLVHLPKFPAIELTRLLRQTIADQLPMAQARPWKKRIKAAPFPTPGSRKAPNTLVDKPWPIDAVVHWYPAKRTYGKGEKILFELKLVGPGADHGFFLEVILPALEVLAKASDSPVRYTNSLWGHFDIPSVYTARGTDWKPLIRDGKLDLRYKVNSTQWASGIKLDAVSVSPNLKCLTWMTPFSLERGNPQFKGAKKDKSGPSLRQLLQEARRRIDTVSVGGFAWDDPTSQTGDFSWNAILRKADRNRIILGKFEKRNFTPRKKYLGFQRFTLNVPAEFIPYLQLASLFHIGEDTHYGFGSFTIG